MNPDDPFAKPRPDQTIIKPSPGGLRPSPGGERPAQPVAPRSVASHSIEPLPHAGLNAIEEAASELLRLVIQLKSTTAEPSIEQLRGRVNQKLQDFESALARAGYEAKIVKATHYCMCSLIDEVILGTPWGVSGNWRENSLLSSFHRDTWGGEQFFAILDRASQNPGGNRDLLEFIYLCLSLGFEGKYATLPNGAVQLNQVRENLYQLIRAHRPEFERELSPAWRPGMVKSSRLARYVPLWALAAVCAGLLLATYTGFSYRLNDHSDPMLRQIHELDGKDLGELAKPIRPPSRRARNASATLQELLADEVEAGRVILSEDANSVTVSLVGDGMFASGLARISDAYQDILLKVAEALGQVPGAVLITGHTDNQPIRTPRFPSNWHLSQERADAVREFLVGKISAPARFTAQGRADTEPIEPNDTPQGRSRNRRVEITLSPQRRESAPAPEAAPS